MWWYIVEMQNSRQLDPELKLAEVVIGVPSGPAGTLCSKRLDEWW